MSWVRAQAGYKKTPAAKTAAGADLVSNILGIPPLNRSSDGPAKSTLPKVAHKTISSFPYALPNGSNCRQSAHMYMILKHFHVTFAVLTMCGFLLRGYWMLSGSIMHQNRATKVAPHIVDTLFFATAVWMILEAGIAPLQHAWLVAKFAGLLAYIGFGMVAFRCGRSVEVRATAFIAAIASFAYVVGAAVKKSPVSWIAA